MLPRLTEVGKSQTGDEMNQKTIAILAPIAVLVTLAVAFADDSNKNHLTPYKFLTTISIPGGLTGFDISWVDSDAARYYLADRGNATATPPVPPRIDVIDTEHDSFLYSIGLTAGPNGVVAIHRTGDRGEDDQPGTLVVGLTNHTGMTDSGALFIDLAHPTSTPVFVSTNGNHRADELAFDPTDHVILI